MDIVAWFELRELLIKKEQERLEKEMCPPTREEINTFNKTTYRAFVKSNGY